MRSNNPYNNTHGSLIDSFQVNHNDKTLRNSPSDHTIQKRVFSTTFEDDEAADSMMNEVVNGSSCSTMMMEFNSNYPQRDETMMMESHEEMNCFDLSSLQPRHTGSSFPLTSSNHHDELNGSIMTSLHRPEYTFLDEPMDALIHHHPFNPVSTTTTSTTTNSFSSTSFGSNNSSANTLNSFNPLLLMVPSSSVDSSLSSSSTTTTDSSPLFPLNLSFDEAELNVIEKAFFFQPQISSPLIQPQQQQQAPFMNEEEGIMMIGSTSTAAVIHSITDVDVDPQPQQPPFRNDPQQQQQQNHTQCLYEESPTMISSQQSVRTTCYNHSSHATTTPQDAHHYNNHSSSQYLQQSLNYNNLQNLNYNNNNNHKQQQQQRTRTSVANPSSHRRRSQSCSSFSSFSNKNPQPTNASLYMNFIPSSSSSLYSQPSSSLTLITSEHSEEPPIMTLNNSNTFTVPSHHHQRTFSSSPNSFSTSPPFMFHSFHPNSGGMNSPSELNTMMNQASLNSPSSSTSSSMNILNGNKINSPSSSVSASASPTLDNAAVKKKRKSKLFRGHFQSTSTFRKDDKWQFHGQDDSNDLVFYHFLPSSAKQKKKEKNLQQ